MSEDQRLLHEYVTTASRQALEELIRRHLALVYSAAVRQVRDPHLAEDVTQAVFLVLTKKARGIRSGVALGGWLHSVTRSVSVNAMKKQATHRKYELLAAKPERVAAAVVDQAADPWERVAPLLDRELNRLAVIDRDAVVLRFFQDRTFAEIGVELGLSEEAARKRVNRALDRLRVRLSSEKDSVTAGVLSMAISSFAVQAVPSHVSVGMIAACIGTPAPHCLSLAKGACNMLKWTKAKLISAAASAILGTTGVVLVAQAIANRADISTPAPISPASNIAAAPAPTQDPFGTAGSIVVTAKPSPAANAKTDAPLTVTSGVLVLQNQIGAPSPAGAVTGGNLVLTNTSSQTGTTGTLTVQANGVGVLTFSANNEQTAQTQPAPGAPPPSGAVTGGK